MRILLADDDRLAVRIVQDALESRGYEVITAKDGEEAWQALAADDAPSLAILDWVMPAMTGIEVCSRVRTLDREHYTYMILLTGQESGQVRHVGLEHGADACLGKPFDEASLDSHLRAGKRIVDLQERLIAAREQLREQATHDPLTGLWNHGEILRMLGREIARSRREGSPLAILMADVDNFKMVNDTLGHQVGDSVLKHVTQKLCISIRPYDTVGRYGGEEFLVLLPGCTEENARTVAERLRTRIEADTFTARGAQLHLTVSVGVAVLGPVADAPIDALLHAADEALYAAKQAGRNRVVLGSPVHSS